MKIRPVSAELFHAEGRRTDRYTDMTRPIAAFHNFVKAPKKGQPSKGNLGVRFTILQLIHEISKPGQQRQQWWQQWQQWHSSGSSLVLLVVVVMVTLIVVLLLAVVVQLLLVMVIIIIILPSPVTGLLPLVFFLLNQRCSPPLRLLVSGCSTFYAMCDVPSTAVICRESIEFFFLVHI